MSSKRSRRRQLPDCFQGQDDGTVLCLVCDKTIQYESIRNHTTSQGHEFKAATLAAAANRAQEEEGNYLSLFEGSSDQHLNRPESPSSEADGADDSAHATEPGLLVDVEMELETYASTYADAHASTGTEDYLQRQADGLERLPGDLALLYMHDDMVSGSDDATLPENVQLEDEEDEDEDAQSATEELRAARDGEWAPFPNLTVFLLILLDALPRLRLSDAQMRIILWVMALCGARNVPSLHKLRKWQKRLHKCGSTTTGHRSTLGNIFYSNNICGTIAMDFAKPVVSHAMRHYPEISSKGISEIRHAGRWGEMDLDHLTPMHVQAGEHYYVNELCALRSGRFFIPKLWHLRDDKLHASGYACRLNLDGTLHVVSDRFVLVPASEFATSFPTLVEEGHLPGFDGCCELERSMMPNALRELADGCELYSVFLNVFGDDVSGNVSKQYNKHNNIYVTNLNLPSSMLSQEFFVHFFSTSPHASTAEQFAALRNQMEATHVQPFPAFNAATNAPCKFRLYPFAFCADNPQQSDECSCALGQATCNCRKCHNRRRPPENADEGDLGWYVNNFAPGVALS